METRTEPALAGGAESWNPGGPAGSRRPRILSMTAAQLFAAVLALIFVAEAGVMLLLPRLGLDAESSPMQAALVDGILLTLFLLPVLYAVLFRRLRRYLESWDRIHRQQQATEQRFRDVAANALEWIWEVDPQGRYTYASPAVRDILGFPAAEVIGRRFSDFFHPDDRDTLQTEVFEIFNRRQPFRGQVNRCLHRDGRTVWLSSSGVPVLAEDGRLLGYRGVDADVSELKDMELRLKEAALTDELTGLLNRRGFVTLSEHQIAVAQRERRPLALLFADVDNMKPINDQHGHAFGDQALADLARILRQTFRRSDVIGRLGGDEFALLLMVTEAVDIENRIIGNLHDAVTRFNQQGQRPYTLSVSVGYATCAAGDHCSLDALLVAADRLMYEHKRQRRTPRLRVA